MVVLNKSELNLITRLIRQNNLFKNIEELNLMTSKLNSAFFSDVIKKCVSIDSV